MDQTKKPWQSKTMLLGLVTALAPFIPGVSEWITANNDLFLSITGFIFMVLRLITKDKIVIS